MAMDMRKGNKKTPRPTKPQTEHAHPPPNDPQENPGPNPTSPTESPTHPRQPKPPHHYGTRWPKRYQHHTTPQMAKDKSLEGQRVRAMCFCACVFFLIWTKQLNFLGLYYNHCDPTFFNFANFNLKTNLRILWPSAILIFLLIYTGSQSPCQSHVVEW